MKSPTARRRKTKLYHVLSELPRQRLHHEVSKSEKDNLGLEAAHTFQRSSSASLKLHNKAQKWRYQRKYVQKLHQNFKGPKFKLLKVLKEFFATHKRTLYVLLGFGGLLTFALMSLSSCAQLATTISSSVLTSSYTADAPTLAAVSRAYTRLEADLQDQINHISTTYPGYDYYHYQLGHIGHDPHVLMAFLTARFGSFTLAEVTPTLNQLFSQTYRLKLREWVETINDTIPNPDPEEPPIEVSYDLYHLIVRLEVTPLEQVVITNLTPEEEDLYALYQTTKGNLQGFSNPFDFDWRPYVSSPYGWRVHPITSNLQLHQGLDLAVPLNTPLRAIHAGMVSRTGYDPDGLGLYIVLEDTKGYQSLYGHLSAIHVNPRQSLTAGQIIGAIGSTGASTGSHLHLELSYRGQQLNPYLHLRYDLPPQPERSVAP